MQKSQESIHQRLVSVITNLSVESDEEGSIESCAEFLETCDKWVALISRLNWFRDINNVFRGLQQPHAKQAIRRDEVERMPSMSHTSKCRTQARSSGCSGAVYFILIGLILLAAINLAASSKYGLRMELSHGSLQERSGSTSETRIEEQKSNSNTIDASPIVVTHANVLFRGIRLRGINQRGKEGNVIAFLGIRYANPPVNRLRFMPPTDYHYAPGLVHDAQRTGPICWQRWPIDYHTLAASGRLSSAGDSVETWLRLTKTVMPRLSLSKRQHLFRQLVGMEQSEDCLNLNIYTPGEASLTRNHSAYSPVPVLLIIHGESFDYGTGSILNPTRFVEEKRIIVITFNYRLNILGFPPKLSGPSRSNLGLLDQVAALLWIKDNIGAFGGAAHNITLMGSKEGAIFVNLLMLSPMAKGLFQRAVMEDGSALTPLVVNNMNTSPAWANNQPMMQHIRILGQLSNCFPKRKPALNSSALDAESAPEVLGADDSKSNSVLLECLKQLPIEQLLTPIPLDIVQPGPRLDSLPVIQRRWLQPGTPEHNSEAAAGPDASQLVPLNSDLLRNLFNRAASQQLETPEGSEPDELFGAIYLQPSMTTMFGPLMDGVIVAGDELNRMSASRSSSLAQKDLLIGLTGPLLGDIEDGKSFNHNHLLLSPPWISSKLQSSGLTNEQALNLVNKFVRSHYRWHNQEIANSVVAHYLNQANLYVQASSSDANEALLSHQQMLLAALREAFQDATVNVPTLRTALIHAMRQAEILSDTFVAKCFEELSQLPTNARNLAKIDFLGKFQAFVEASLSNQILSLTKPETRSLKTTYLYQIDTRLWMRHIDQQVENLAKFREPVWQAIKFSLIYLSKQLAKDDLQMSIGCIFYIEEADYNKHDLYSTFKNWLCLRMGSILSNFIKNELYESRAEEHKNSLDFNERIGYFTTRCTEELNLSNPFVDHHLTQVATSRSTLGASLAANCESELISLVFEYLQESQSIGSDWKPFDPISQYVATLPAPNRNLVQMNHISNNQDHKISILSRFSFWTDNIPTFNCSKTQVIQPSLVLSSSKGWNSSVLLNSNIVFSCQTGAHTYLEVLKRIASNIKQQVALLLEQLDIKRKLESEPQMNIASSASVLNLTDAESQQVSNHAKQLLVDSMPSDSPPVLTSSILNDDETVKADHSRTRYAGSVLFICTLLLTLSLVFALKVVLNHRRRQTRARKSDKEVESNEKEMTLTEADSSRTSVQEGLPKETGNQMSSVSSGEQEMVHVDSEAPFHIEPCFFEEQQELLSRLSHIHPTHLIVNSVSQPMHVHDYHTSLSSSIAGKSVRLTSDQDEEMSLHHEEPILNSWQAAEEIHELPIFNAYHTATIDNHKLILNGKTGNEQHEFVRSSSKKRVKISDSVDTMRQYNTTHRRTERSPSMNQIGDMMYCDAHREGILNQQQNYCRPGRSTDQIHICPVDDRFQRQCYYSDALPVYQGEQSSKYPPKMITSIIPIGEHSRIEHS